MIDKRKPIVRTLNNIWSHPLNFFNFTTNSEILIEKLEKFLFNPEKLNATILENIITQELSSFKILIYSEYVLSAAIFKHVIEIGAKKRWKDYLIVGLDAKMEEIIQSKLYNFRCDMILLIENKLIILEYKFRNDRSSNQKEKAKQCINKRFYMHRVLNYLKNQTPYFKNVEIINLIGIGFSIKNGEIQTGIEFEIHEKSLIQLDVLYSSKEFLSFLGFKRPRIENNESIITIPKEITNDKNAIKVKNDFITYSEHLCVFYEKLFPKMDKNIKEWTKNYCNFGIFINNELVGCCTYRILKIKNIKILNILLFGTIIQEKGYGTYLLNKIKEIHPKILAWIDKSSLDWFLGRDFKKQFKLGFMLQCYIKYHSNAKFCVSGLLPNEINILKK